jgi:hypothetical protein
MSEKQKVLPPISPDDKHLDELIWERIIMRNGQPVHQIWRMERQYFPCGRCKMPDNIKFISLPTGAYKTCKYCGFTEDAQPVNTETNEERAELLSDKVVSVEEAWEILKKHKSHPYAPLNLPPAKVRRERLRTV